MERWVDTERENRKVGVEKGEGGDKEGKIVRKVKNKRGR